MNYSCHSLYIKTTYSESGAIVLATLRCSSSGLNDKGEVYFILLCKGPAVTHYTLRRSASGLNEKGDVYFIRHCKAEHCGLTRNPNQWAGFDPQPDPTGLAPNPTKISGLSLDTPHFEFCNLKQIQGEFVNMKILTKRRGKE